MKTIYKLFRIDNKYVEHALSPDLSKLTARLALMDVPASIIRLEEYPNSSFGKTIVRNYYMRERIQAIAGNISYTEKYIVFPKSKQNV